MNKISIRPYKLILYAFNIAFKKYGFKGNSLTSLFFLVCAQPFAVILYYFKTKPDTITYLRFFFGLIIIYYELNGDIQTAIVLFIFFKIFDYVDGSLARLYGKKTFYGKFIDSVCDLFIEVFFLVFLGFYFFDLLNDYNLLKLYISAAIFWIFGQFIYDKYGSLVRWSNLENKKKTFPNIRDNKFLRLMLILEDSYFFSIFLILYNCQSFGLNASYILIFSCFFFGLLNITLHLISASKNLREKKK
jgi:phosphatidylglycerophosphate synthase